MFVITMYFEGPKKDWYYQLGHPRKIKNLLTTYIKTDLQNCFLRSNLMRFQRIIGKIFFENRCFKRHKKEIKKTTIGISQF